MAQLLPMWSEKLINCLRAEAPAEFARHAMRGLIHSGWHGHRRADVSSRLPGCPCSWCQRVQLLVVPSGFSSGRLWLALRSRDLRLPPGSSDQTYDQDRLADLAGIADDADGDFSFGQTDAIRGLCHSRD